MNIKTLQNKFKNYKAKLAMQQVRLSPFYLILMGGLFLLTGQILIAIILFIGALFAPIELRFNLVERKGN